MANDVKFIRRNGRIIPISGKKKGSFGKTEARKKIKRTNSALKGRNTRIEHNASKGFAAGFGLGAGVSMIKGKALGTSLLAATIMGTITSALVGGGREKRRNIEKMADNKEILKLAQVRRKK